MTIRIFLKNGLNSTQIIRRSRLRKTGRRIKSLFNASSMIMPRIFTEERLFADSARLLIIQKIKFVLSSHVEIASNLATGAAKIRSMKRQNSST